MLTALAVPAAADTIMDVGDPIAISTQQPDLGLASKVRIVRLETGGLVAIYLDGVGSEIYDIQEERMRAARDVFARRCEPAVVDCGVESNWSEPQNLSGSALLSSLTTQWTGPANPAEPFSGDASKATIFAQGSNIVVTWASAYCPGGEQRSVRYQQFGSREVPFGCLWTIRSNDGGATWTNLQQLTSGARDVQNDVHRGSQAGWAIAWQEDAGGLQFGEADGDGDGASGASVSGGTDVWYAFVTNAQLTAGADFAAPIRVTDNFTRLDPKPGVWGLVESGDVGASRPNVQMVGPTLLLAYEETKGASGTGSEGAGSAGKLIRFHSFPFNAPPTSCALDLDGETCLVSPDGDPFPAIADSNRMGCILSDPAESGRRVRFFAQGTAGPTSGAKLFVLWRQGTFNQGGPSDIVARTATGFAPADFYPAVAAPSSGASTDGCLVESGASLNAPGINLSADTLLGGDLEAGTADNAAENSNAHRGLIAGDTVVIGYDYTADWAAATASSDDHYNFFVRRSLDGGITWDTPTDLTLTTLTALADQLGVAPTAITVREPRLVRTPGDGPGCPSGDPAAPETTNPQHCSAPDTYFVAWGTQQNINQPGVVEQDLDLFVTRTTDGGDTYETVQRLAAGDAIQVEAQLASSPDGKLLHAVFNEVSSSEQAMYVAATEAQEPMGGGGEGGVGGGSGGVGGAPSGGAGGEGPVGGNGEGGEPVGAAGGGGDDIYGDGDGCSCRVPRGGAQGSWGLLAALLGAALMRLHRRR